MLIYNVTKTIKIDKFEFLALQVEEIGYCGSRYYCQ